jgi:VWFA-related protein
MRYAKGNGSIPRFAIKRSCSWKSKNAHWRQFIAKQWYILMCYFGTVEQSSHATVKSSDLCALLTATVFLVAGASSAPKLNPSLASQLSTPPNNPPQLRVTLWLTVFYRGEEFSGPEVTSTQTQVFEDGHLQSNVTLSREEKEPVAVGLLMQASGERRNTLPHAEIEPAINFFRSVLKNGSIGFAETFSDHTEVVRKFTTQPAEMERDLRKSANFELRGCSALFDAIASACKKVATLSERRRALVVVADGHDNCSEKTAKNALEAALRAQVRIYFINLAFVDLSDSAPAHNRERPARIFRLQELSKQLAEPTGGTAINLLGPEGFASALDGIGFELEVQHKLTYISSNPVHDGKFRSIKIDRVPRGVEILAPIGYYAPKD